VFRSDRDGNAEIYVMNASDGFSQKRLTRKSALDHYPAWSPGGSKIAFTSQRGGDEEIYSMKARPEGSENRPKNLPKNTDTDLVPGWQPLP
jgi:Tol biopolymer transport system component